MPEELDTYRCQSCNKIISLKEFNKRARAKTWVDGKTPLILCEICGTWHCPQDFDINSQMRISYMDRDLEITDMKNGRFAFASDHDESGYVIAITWTDAVAQIKNWFQMAVRSSSSP